MSTELYVDKVLKWNRDGVPTGLEDDAIYWKSLTVAERNAASTYCGPHKSYPLGPGCNHVSAAFTLGMSGHGQPNMACIRNYARSHGCSIPPSQKSYNAVPDPKQWRTGYSAERPKRMDLELPDVGRSTF
jgi:hypothetical protein